MKMDWSSAIYQLQKQGKAYVIVTVIGISGSTPRSNGTKMVVSRDKLFDTIGGGHLEHKSIQFAHKLLSENSDCQHIEHFELGIHLDQCCGGSANVLFECFAANQVNIMLFGAGHVGQALIPILASLPCQISWVDSRESWLSKPTIEYQNVKKIISEDPEQQVADMPANSYYVVMTHKHQLDFNICHQVILRDDFSYLGLIGSQTKWHRFTQRYLQQNISVQQLEAVHCPIGLSEVPGKRPSEVAVSIAAEIIAHYSHEIGSHEVSSHDIYIHKKNSHKNNSQVISEDAISKSVLEQQTSMSTTKKGVSWKQLKPLLKNINKTSKVNL